MKNPVTRSLWNIALSCLIERNKDKIIEEQNKTGLSREELKLIKKADEKKAQGR